VRGALHTSGHSCALETRYGAESALQRAGSLDPSLSLYPLFALVRCRRSKKFGPRSSHLAYMSHSLPVLTSDHQAGRPLYLPPPPKSAVRLSSCPRRRSSSGASDRGNAEAVANKAQRTCAEARSEGRMSPCKDGIPTA
jgi:hypothetical protein